ASLGPPHLVALLVVMAKAMTGFPRTQRPAQHHDFTYGTPSARGPRTLPTRPATTMIVTTYGVSSSRFDWIGTLMLDRIDWSWVVKPNSSAAPIAPSGVYRPKIIAASAM